MPSDYRQKLRRLGVHKGATKLRTAPRQPARMARIEDLVDGRLIDTPNGETFIHEESYAADHVHGGHALGHVLRLSPSIAAQIANDPALARVDFGRAAFLDTETTGLSGGAGTLVFLVGVGAFDVRQSSFVLRQFFLRSPAEEPAMLHALAEWLDACDAIVSFNGRGFDLPLLDSRFRLARMRPKILRAPHLDLLAPARRVWRGRLPSCALSSLERHILDVRREQDDVPGHLIPEMYMNYVRAGDASEMPRVLYHNAIDVLSMVALSTRLLALFAAAPPVDPTSRGDDLAAADWLALGRWRDDLGRVAEAESALRACLAAQPDAATRSTALLRLGSVLKRSNRRKEAVRVWEALSDSPSREGAAACVELAKHYEWREVNLARAIAWTREAIAIASDIGDAYLRAQLHAELAQRMRRLDRKR